MIEVAALNCGDDRCDQSQSGISRRSSRMKRILVFAMLGPLIGFVTFMALAQALNYGLDGSWQVKPHYIVLVPLGYAVGIVPALLAAWFDYAVRYSGYRVLWTAMFSYVAGFMPVMTAFWAGFLHAPYVLVVGLVAVVPGAVCSWLSGEPRQSHARSATYPP
jgi:hypothetical protein